jgi:hypothetical protein
MAVAVAALGVGVLSLALGIDVLILSLTALAAAGFGLMLITSFMDDLNNSMPDLIDKGVTLIISFIQALADALIDNADELADALFELILGALIVLGTFTEKFLEAGKDLLVALGEGIKEKAGAVKRKITQLGTSLKEKIRTAISDFVQAGIDMVLGLISGVKGMIDTAINTVKDFASSILDGFKEVLGISSPSKKFIECGKYIDMGLVVGLDEYSDKVYSQTKEVGETAVSSLSDPLKQISSIIDGTLDVDPTIRPVMDLTDIQNGSQMIDGMFANRSVQLAGINDKLNGLNVDANLRDKKSANNDIVEELRTLRSGFADMSQRLDNMQVVMDSGQLVGAISAPMDRSLGNISIRKGRRN